MKKLNLAILCLTPFLLVACAEKSDQQLLESNKSQLQMREFQMRQFQVTDQKVVVKAIVNALQDMGFMVKNAVVDAGIVVASKEKDIEDGGEAFLTWFFQGNKARYSKNSILEATVNFTEAIDQTKIRASFQLKILDNKGGIKKVKTIDDLKFYQDFFSRIDKAMYLQKEKIG